MSILQSFLSIHNCLKSNPLLERQETTIYNEIVGDIYEEPLAQQFGRCFSYYSYEDFELNSGRDYSFKTAHDLRIFFHPKGDELWFTGFFEFPYEVSSVTLDITKQPNISLALISLREIRSVLHPKPQMPCTDYKGESNNEHELFAKCCKESLWKNLPAGITCTVADMKQFIPKNSTMPECNCTKEASNVYWKLNKLITNFTPKLWT